MNRREAERKLKQIGFAPVKGGKKHDKWQHSDGRMVTFSRSGKHSDLYGFFAQKIERMYSGKEVHRAEQMEG